MVKLTNEEITEIGRRYALDTVDAGVAMLEGGDTAPLEAIGRRFDEEVPLSAKLPALLAAGNMFGVLFAGLYRGAAEAMGVDVGTLWRSMKLAQEVENALDAFSDDSADGEV